MGCGAPTARARRSAPDAPPSAPWRGEAGNFPVLLLDGVVGGVWHQRRSGKRLDVTVEPLARLTAAHRRDLDAQVARLGELLEATPHLTIGPVATRAHA